MTELEETDCNNRFMKGDSKKRLTLLTSKEDTEMADSTEGDSLPWLTLLEEAVCNV